MGKNDDRISWSQVPDSPELWASESGQIATLAPGGGFEVLNQHPNCDGKPYVLFARGDRKDKVHRLVARLVLAAFVGLRGSAHPITYADRDVGNCRLANLSWRVGRGEAKVGDCKPRRCLGNDCGHCMFLSAGVDNRLCPVCTRANSYKGSEVEGLHEPGEIPDAPLLSPPLGVGKG